VEQLCDHVAVIDKGRVAISGPLADVQAGGSLEDRFVELVGADLEARRAPSWLPS
jgi:ABC-2 type transport system ATP-binding protein